MEPMVIFSAGLVLFCGYLALIDAVHDRRHSRVGTKKEAMEKRRIRIVSRRAIFSAPCREGGAGARWPRPLTGSA
jgi:hypothetical protein